MKKGTILVYKREQMDKILKILTSKPEKYCLMTRIIEMY